MIPDANWEEEHRIDLDKDWPEEEHRREIGEETERGEKVDIPEVEILERGWAERVMKWVIYG